MRRRLPTALVASAALLVLACIASCEPAKTPPPSGSYVVRLRLPLRDPAARACESTCLERGDEATNVYLECLSGCPGAELDDDKACSESDKKPSASCYVVQVRVHEDEAADGGSALLDIIGVVATMGVAAAGQAIENAAKPKPKTSPTEPHAHMRRGARDGG